MRRLVLSGRFGQLPGFPAPSVSCTDGERRPMWSVPNAGAYLGYVLVRNLFRSEFNPGRDSEGPDDDEGIPHPYGDEEGGGPDLPDDDPSDPLGGPREPTDEWDPMDEPEEDWNTGDPIDDPQEDDWSDPFGGLDPLNPETWSETDIEEWCRECEDDWTPACDMCLEHGYLHWDAEPEEAPDEGGGADDTANPGGPGSPGTTH